jgi:hypothetical protein
MASRKSTAKDGVVVSRYTRGFALAVALIIVAIVTIVVFMAVNVANLESRAVRQDVQGARALYAARAGLSMAMSNLTGLRDPNWGNPEVTMELSPGLSFRVNVVPHPNNTTPPLRSQLAWMVTSTGLVGSPPAQVQRTLQAFVQQEPFSRYAYFTDVELGQGGQVIRFVSNDAITGPVHTNGFYTFAGHPRFSETVRSANRALPYDSNGLLQGYDPYYTPPTDPPNPQPAHYNSPGNAVTTDPALFYHCENNGSNTVNGPVALAGSTQFSMAGGQQIVPLPIDNQAIYSVAQETGQLISAPLPANPGAQHYSVAPDSVVYRAEYDENTGRMTSYTRDGSAITAQNAPPVFKLTFRADATVTGAEVYKWDPNTSSFRAWNVAAQDYSANPNAPTVIDTTAQTLYVNGTCLLEGTVSGRTTIGVRYDTGIIDNLVYRERASDVLGIVANQSIILESRINVVRDRSIHATMMALNGSFYVDKYNQGSPRGILHLYGGIIQRVRGAVGTGSASTIATGYAKDYIYDDKLVFRPPLNFPTTPNVYIVSLRDQGAVGSL